MNKNVFMAILAFSFILILASNLSTYDTQQRKSPNNLDQKKEDILKAELNQKDEKIIDQKPAQDLPSSSLLNAVDVYRDTINFLEWMIGIIITLLVGFGIFIWLRYKSFEKKARNEIYEFQKAAREETENLKSRIKHETKKFETTGKIFSGIAQINFGKKQEAIPYLEGALNNKEVLTNEQLLFAFFALGTIYCDLNNISAANHYSKEAINLNPNIPLTHILMS